MRLAWARLPLYPVLLVASFLLAAFFDSDVSPYAAFRVAFIVLGIAGVLTVAAVLVLGPVRGGLAAGIIVLVARLGSPLHLVAAVALIALTGAAWRVSRRLWPQSVLLREPTGALNLISSLLVAVTLVGALVDGSFGRTNLAMPAGPDALVVDQSRGRGDAPDIYVILLDGYPRADTLARLFDFDNGPFLEALRERGFAVSSGSSSNYMYTELTLASLFHMQYLDDIPNREDVQVPIGLSLRSTINSNPVWDELRARGYVVATALSPWENVALRSADVVCGDAPNEYELFLARTTLAGQALTAINPTLEADSHRAAVIDSFTCLAEMSIPTTKPKLVFTHIGSPHLPVVFAADGGPASPDLFGFTASDPAASPRAFRNGYVDQLKYLNASVLAAIEPLIERPDEPIVIVMSDHGSELNLDWGSALNSDLRERFGNLFAAYTPGHASLFPCDVTPIEIFPTLLDAYFDEDIPIPRRRFFATAAQGKLAPAELPAGSSAPAASGSCPPP